MIEIGRYGGVDDRDRSDPEEADPDLFSRGDGEHTIYLMPHEYDASTDEQLLGLLSQAQPRG